MMFRNIFLRYITFIVCLWCLGIIVFLSLQPHIRLKHHEEKMKLKIADLQAKVQSEISAANHVAEQIRDLKKNVASHINTQDSVIAVLLIACNRVSVRRTLDSLLKYRPSADTFPIIVSQDCNHLPTQTVLQSYVDQHGIKLILHPNQSPIHVKRASFAGYYRIARHYQWALNQVFNTMNYEACIIFEDDLDVSSDIFEYFLATLPLLKKDPTLWCVSAWNDNGKQWLIDPNYPQKLHRSDFFSGLGWMLTKELWEELGPKWPPGFWDDWMREEAQRKGRSCIRPEVSRTITFGEKGISRNSFVEIAKTFQLMDDFKAGVARTAYLGIVTFFYRGCVVYITPSKKWKGYLST